MLPQQLLSGELSREEKLQVARGEMGGAEVPAPQLLNMLVVLAADTDAEVSGAAQETLQHLPDEQCVPALAAPTLPEPVARYFLDPSHARPALLPTLLANPASPQDAIIVLAAKSTREVLEMLLEILDLLKPPVLAALKNNPLHEGWRKEPSAETVELAPEEKLQAARGEMEIPADQLLNVLVSLTADADPEVCRAAHQTLSRLQDEQCVAELASWTLPESVARYFLDLAHVRPVLLPALLANPASPLDAITVLAANAGPEVLQVLLEELDLLQTPVLIALKDNPTHEHWQKDPPAEGLVLEVDLLDMLIEEMQSETPPPPPTAEEETAAAPADPSKPEGLVSKIARMTVAQHLKLALLGTKEERGFLIRDGSKVIQRGVLSSPKLTDGEAENFAALKNVSQDVLRLISMNRKFMKNYVVLKNLVNNPRLPIDVGLPLLNRLIVTDLRSLSTNKNVPDTVRKMAEKMFKTKKT